MKNDNSAAESKRVPLVRNLAKETLCILSALRRRLLLPVFNGSVAPNVPGVTAKKKKRGKGFNKLQKLFR